MKKINEGDLTIIIVFGILTFGAIIASILLWLIQLSRFFFWFSLVGVVISFILLIFFSFAYFTNREDLFYEDRSGLFALICLGGIVFLFILARGCYNFGYSDEAIEREMELKGYLEEYNKILNLFNLPAEIKDDAVEQTLDDLCKNQDYPCEEVREGYETYKDITGMKDLADKFSKILIVSNKKGPSKIRFK